MREHLSRPKESAQCMSPFAEIALRAPARKASKLRLTWAVHLSVPGKHLGPTGARLFTAHYSDLLRRETRGGARCLAIKPKPSCAAFHLRALLRTYTMEIGRGKEGTVSLLLFNTVNSFLLSSAEELHGNSELFSMELKPNR